MKSFAAPLETRHAPLFGRNVPCVNHALPRRPASLACRAPLGGEIKRAAAGRECRRPSPAGPTRCRSVCAGAGVVGVERTAGVAIVLCFRHCPPDIQAIYLFVRPAPVIFITETGRASRARRSLFSSFLFVFAPFSLSGVERKRQTSKHTPVYITVLIPGRTGLPFPFCLCVFFFFF